MPEAQERKWHLPPGTLPLGLSRLQASEYVGVSTTLWDAMVDDKRMPQPKRIGRRRVWDRTDVEKAFRNLDDGMGAPPVSDPDEADDWDNVAP